MLIWSRNFNLHEVNCWDRTCGNKLSLNICDYLQGWAANDDFKLPRIYVSTWMDELVTKYPSTQTVELLLVFH